MRRRHAAQEGVTCLGAATMPLHLQRRFLDPRRAFLRRLRQRQAAELRRAHQPADLGRLGRQFLEVMGRHRRRRRFHGAGEQQQGQRSREPWRIPHRYRYMAGGVNARLTPVRRSSARTASGRGNGATAPYPVVDNAAQAFA